MISGAIPLAAGLWAFAPPSVRAAEIHRSWGTPRRWGLFGENNQEQINNISPSIIDLYFYSRPLATLHYAGSGQQTDIDIYLIAMSRAKNGFYPCMMK